MDQWVFTNLTFEYCNISDAFTFFWVIDSHWKFILFLYFKITYGNLNHPWQDKAGRGSGPSKYEGVGSPVRSLCPFYLHFILLNSVLILNLKIISDKRGASVILILCDGKIWIIWEPTSREWITKFWVPRRRTSFIWKFTIWNCTLWLHGRRRWWSKSF